MRRGREAACVLLAASTLLLTGCIAGTIAKQALKEVRGAHGDVLPIGDFSDLALSKYRSIEFTPATTSAGNRLCPPGLLRTYDRSANQLAAKLKPGFPEAGGAPTLTIDSDILYFQGKGALSGAFMLTRVKMREDARVAVEAMVRTESESFRAGGEDDLANASVAALGKFLKRHGPPRAAAKEPE